MILGFHPEMLTDASKQDIGNSQLIYQLDEKVIMDYMDKT